VQYSFLLKIIGKEEAGSEYLIKTYMDIHWLITRSADIL